MTNICLGRTTTTATIPPLLTMFNILAPAYTYALTNLPTPCHIGCFSPLTTCTVSECDRFASEKRTDAEDAVKRYLNAACTGIKVVQV